MIRVLISEDNEFIRQRYENILNDSEDCEVVASVSTGSEAVAAFKQYKPDIILMDIEMESKKAGLVATQAILKQDPDAKIMILTVYENDEMVYEAFKLGVVDYIIKNNRASEIISAIKDAYFDCSSIDSQIAEKLRREFKRMKLSEDHFEYILQTYSRLTQSEIEIIHMVNRGYTRADLCKARCVELSTIKTQINIILKKFDMKSLAEVIRHLRDNHVLDYLSNMLGINTDLD